MKVPPPGSSAERVGLPHAGELFTDRTSESQAFKMSLAAFRRYLDRDAVVGTDRHNVLTFHGVGGIGKTALSARMEAWVNQRLPIDNGWGPRPDTKVDMTARIDLHGSAGRMDLLSALVALRSGVTGLRRRWPAFDLAFAAYWSAVRPGEPLPQFRGQSDLSDSVLQTLGDALGDLGSVADLTGAGTGAGLAVRGVRRVVGELRRRRDVRLAIVGFPDFEEFLLRCADEPSATDPAPGLACDIAGILSWELSSISPSPMLVVFIDTVERLSLDPQRVSEGHLNMLVHRMPNVLFVLTGRNMLDWYDANRADLPYRGIWTWPGLVPGSHEEPRQHLVGDLSPQDTRDVIRRGRRLYDLPFSDRVVDELVTASRGLPQYLELARQVAISIRDSGTGRQVEIADVTGSLGSLVQRVLDDIPPDEQRALRAASLFRLFDTRLMAAAGDVDHGCAERAAQRPMIDRYDGELYPYRMHDAIRESVRRADHRVPGGWSARDWSIAASRAVAEAHRMHDEAKQGEDVRGVLDAIGIAIGLLCEQEVALEASTSPSYEDWLSQAIVYSPSVQGLRSRIPTQSATAYGRGVLEFIAAKSIETPVETRLQLLRSVFDSDHPLRLPAGRHLGYTYKSQHRWDEAIAVFDKVIEIAPTNLNKGQRPQVFSLARRFIEARAAAKGLPVAATVARVEEYAHGRPGRYFSEIGDKLTMLRVGGRQREYLEEMGDYLVRRAFFRDDLADTEVDRFTDEVELAHHVVGNRSALLAAVLSRRGDATDRLVWLERLRELDEASIAAGTIGFRFALAEFCDATLSANRDRLVALQSAAVHVSPRTRSWIPIECFLESVGLPLPRVPTQWLEPYAMVRSRWYEHLNSYLERHGGNRVDALA